MAERSPGIDSTFYVPRGTHGGSSSSSSQPSGLSGGNDNTSSSAKHCQNGLLQFRFTSLQDSQSFTYATLPGVNLTPLDWKICCTPDSDLPSEHVTYYQLTDAEKCLVDVVEEQCYVKSDVIGLIIINYNSSIYLSKEMFKKGVPKKPPMYVVTLEDGEQIVEFFNTKVDDGDMMVKVLVDSGVNYGLEGKISHDILKAHETGFHLHEELKRLMLNNRKRIHILGAATSMFQFIFSCFQNYEAQPKRDSHSKAITKLFDNFKDEMFSKDFLFYLLVAYRLKVYAKKYNSDDIIYIYLFHCIEKFESLTDIQRIAEIIHLFVQRGNFTVQWYPYYQKADCAVFTLLCHMAEAMLTQSMKLKEVNNVAVYPRILWIGVNIFFGLQCKIDPATLSSIWLSGLINEKVLEKLEFSEGTVTDFIKGFKFCELLQLPRGVFFDASSFASLLDPIKCKGLHFSHITKIIEAGVCHLRWDSGFLFYFMPPIRSHYEALFKKHKERNVAWDGCSGDGTKSGVYKEAVQFLECMVKFSIHETDTSAAIGVEVQKFLEFLVNNVDFKADNAVECLKELQNSRLPKKYSTTITNAVNLKGMAEMQQLKSTQICKLFKSLNIWQFQFVEKFLNEYTISVTVDLKDPLWSTLLAEIVSRFSTITCKQCIVSLLNRAGKAYKICKNQNSFVTDLLILNVPKLLFVPEDVGCQVEKAFSDMIQSFIQENGLQRIITEQAVVIVDAVKPGNHFHVLLLKAVQKEIVPTANIIDNAANNTMKDLIIRSSEHISKTFTASLQLSDTATFNWSFIALCCKCIQIGEKDLKKLANFSFAIEKLCIIYLTYCDKMMDVSQPLCKVPEGIKYSDIKEYFNWIIKMQGILKYWYELFEQQNYNFDDTITYADMLATIESLARSLNITNLVHKIEQIEELKIKYHELYIKLCTLIVKDAEGCTLEELMKIYGVQLSATIQSMLDSHVILPGRNVNSDEIQQLSQLTLEPHMNLKLRKSLTCKILEELQIQLAIFVSPISEQLDFLVYFHLHNCKLFSNYLKNKMATLSLQPPNEEEPIDNDQKVAIKPEDEMAKLSTALTHTEAFIVKVINGSAKFEDFLLAGMRPEILQAFSYEDDVDTMIEFFESKEACIGATNAKQAISSMLKLLDIVSKLPCVSQLCHQYQLHGCTDDPNFLVLQDIIKSLEKQDTRNNLTGEIADRYMAKLHKIFCCDNNSELQRCLVLFENVAGCTDVYHFIEAKGFFGQTGKFDFWNQLELVTTHLKDEDYCTVALKELASTYEYVTLFMDSKQDFVSLLRQVHKLISNRINLSVDFQKDMCQLEAVNSSITAIRFWFSRVTKNHQASFQEIEYKLAMEIEKRFDEVRTNLIAQSDKAEAANSLLREKFSELESVLNSSLKLAHCEVQNLMQHRERNLQIQIQKFEEKYHVLQSRLLDNEKHQKDIESQLQKSNRDIESKQIQTLNEQIQQQNDTLQLLQTQLDRTNNSIISLNSQVKALSPQWIVDPCEITIDTKQEIGRGAYGTVNVATFRGTKVAAKCLHKAIVSPYYVSTFAREMDMAGRCRHPNLLQFIGATKDSDFIILTEIMDTSLRAAMGNKLIKDDHVVSICLDVAQGLNYLHENNPPILHRDVSSANVLLNELPHNKWLAKLSDYGTANFILNTGTQNPGAVVYAAPEASDPNNQTPKMDVYSYGKLVFEICVNELPTQDVCKAVFPEAETLWSPLKRSLLPLILDCLKHKQEQRLSMRRIIELLQRL